MKRFLLNFGVLSLVLSLTIGLTTSCSDSKTDDGDNGTGTVPTPEPPGPREEVEAQLVSLTEKVWDFDGRWAEPYEIGITLKPVNVIWTVEADKNWVHFEYDEEDDFFTIKLDQNREGQPRQAKVTVYAGTNKLAAEMTVNQGILEPLRISADYQDFPFLGQAISSNGNWGTISDADLVYYRWNHLTNEKTPLQLSLAADVSDDGIVVGDIRGAATYWDGNRYYSVEVPAEATGSYLFNITNDGKTASGWWVGSQNSATENNYTYYYEPFSYDMETGVRTKLETFPYDKEPDPNFRNMGYVNSVYNIRLNKESATTFTGQEVGRVRSQFWYNGKQLLLPDEYYPEMEYDFEWKDNDGQTMRSQGWALLRYPDAIFVSPDGRYIAGCIYRVQATMQSNGKYALGGGANIESIFVYDVVNEEMIREGSPAGEVTAIKNDGWVFYTTFGGMSSGAFNFLTNESSSIGGFLQDNLGIGASNGAMQAIDDEYTVAYTLRSEGIGVVGDFFFK